MLYRVLFILMIVATAPVAVAQSLDVNLNNNEAEFRFGTPAGMFIQGNSEFHGGMLYNDAGNILGEGGVIVRGGEDAIPGLTIGVGVKAVAGAIRNYIPATSNFVQAIAIGADLTYALPMVHRVALIGEYYGSPKITSFGEAERLSQARARLEYEITPQTKAYIGYRATNFGIKDIGLVPAATASVDNVPGWHLGVSITY